MIYFAFTLNLSGYFLDPFFHSEPVALKQTLELQCHCFRGAIQAHCATFNVNSTLGVGEGGGFKLLTLTMWKFQTNFSPLFLELKNHYKHMLNSPQYIFGFQMLSPWRSRQGIVIVRSQSFNRLRVIITLFEMINEPRLKTEPYVTYFLFFLSSKSTFKKKFVIRRSFYNR